MLKMTSESSPSPALSASQWQAALEQIPVILAMFDREGRVRFLNEEGRNFLQRPLDALIGQRSHDILPDAVAQTYQAMLDKVISTGTAQRTEVNGPTGTKRCTVIAHFTPLAGEQGDLEHVLLSAYDISELKHTEAALRVSESNLQAVFEAGVDARMLIGKDLTIRAFNQVSKQRGEKVFGQTLEVGRPLADYVGPNAPNVLEDARQALEGKSMIFERQIQRLDGHEYWVRVHYSPVYNEQGDISAVVFSSRDISESKRREAQLKRLLEFRRNLVLFVEESLKRNFDERFYQHLLERAVAVISGAQAGSIVLKGRHNKYQFVAALGFELTELQKIELELHETLVDPNQKKPVIIRDLIERDRLLLDQERIDSFTRSGDVDGILTSLVAPVFIGGEILAVLYLNNFEDETAFDDEAIDMAEAFAGQVGVLLNRLHLERHLRELATFRQALVDLTEESLQGSLDEHFYQRILERAVEAIPAAEAGSLLLLGEDGNYHFAAAVNFELEKIQRISFEPHELAYELSNAEIQHVDYRTTNSHLPSAKERALQLFGRVAEIQDGLAVPVVSDGQLLAWFNLDSFSDPHAFDQEAIDMARAFANQLAIIMKRLRLEEELRSRQEVLEHLATHDALTGLPNRTLFQDRLEQAIKNSSRHQHGAGLLFLDLDGFKEVNDSLGHKAGDELLKQVAKRLLSTVRQVDTVARLSGDEFTIILESITGLDDLERVSEKVLECINAPYTVNEQTLHITASIGAAYYPHHAESAEALLQAADHAMYAAKQQGKNSYRIATTR